MDIRGQGERTDRETVNQVEVQGEGIVTHILRFCRYLKGQGLKITPGRILDAARALRYVDIAERQDFYLALRCCLVANQEDIEIFDRAFALFWEFAGGDFRSPPAMEQEGPEASTAVQTVELGDGMDGSQWSPYEVLGRRDLTALSVEESREIYCVEWWLRHRLI